MLSHNRLVLLAIALLYVTSCVISANAVVVGDTATFWVTSFQNYPLVVPNSDKYQTQFTCRAVTDHAYIFVQDSAWGTGLMVVTQTHVNDLVTALETRTPSRTDSGLMATIPSTCGAFPNALDRDPKVYIVVTRFHDAIGGLLFPGFFDAANQMSSTISRILQLGYSNQREMVYVNANYVQLPLNTGRSQAHGGLCMSLAQLALYARDALEQPLGTDGIPEWLKLKNGYPNTSGVGFSYPQQFWTMYATRLNPDIVSYQYLDITSRGAYQGAFLTFWQYVAEQLGDSAVRRVAVNSGIGSSGFNNALSYSSRTFQSMFEDWAISNKLDDSTVAGARYIQRHYNPSIANASTTSSYPDSVVGDTLPGYATRYHRFINYSVSSPNYLRTVFHVTTGGPYKLFVIQSNGSSPRTLREVTVSNNQAVIELLGSESTLCVINEQTLGSGTYTIITDVLTPVNEKPSVQSPDASFGWSSSGEFGSGSLGSLHLRTPNHGAITISAFDVLGRLVDRRVFQSNSTGLTIAPNQFLQGRNNGCYFLQAEMSGRRAVTKVVWMK